MLAARIVERDGRIVALEAIGLDSRDGGRRLTLRARLFIIAGGAIASAALMLRSGLAARDASGTLGRNLMRHCNAMMGYLFPFRTNPEHVNHKQICLTDDYESVRAADGTALGVIQDMCMPPAEVVRALGPRGFRWAAAVSAERIQTLLCVAEDDAQAANAVTLSAERKDAFDLPVANVRHEYTSRHAASRHAGPHGAQGPAAGGGMIGKVPRSTASRTPWGRPGWPPRPRPARCRPDCRVWGVPNLFVVDGSFMPTSGG